MSTIILKNGVLGLWFWPRPFLSLVLRGSVLEKSNLAMASDFFVVIGLGLERCALESTFGKQQQLKYQKNYTWDKRA